MPDAPGVPRWRASVLIPWLLTAFAVVYYSLYVRAGLNLGGEGGTAGVIAMRLMEGQRPLVDTFLGYNVLWFLPVAELFSITGPNYLALRWYFFAFCIVTGLLTYFVVHGYTKNPWFSALPAILVILVPGMLFRNYMPFLGVLNAWLLTRAFVLHRESPWQSLAWMWAAGAGLGVTFLFRIDLGLFCTLIFLGLAILYPLGERGVFLRRAGLALAGVAGGLLLLVAVHVPVWQDAKARGWDRAFLNQYTGWFAMIRSELHLQVKDVAKKDEPPLKPTAPAAVEATPKAQSWEDRGGLSRVPISAILNEPRWNKRSFAISTYLPPLVAVLAIALGSVALVGAFIRRDSEAKERILYPLTVLGCALTLFPQFFFFRPDTPHLSEMMVPFLAALALMSWCAGTVALRTSGGMVRVTATAFAALCAVTGGIYFSHAIEKESAGSIAAREKVNARFVALNGVDVLIRERDHDWLSGLRDSVLQHSSPGDFVLCLPYSPTINFMTDRPSPLHNLYVDNSTVGKKFDRQFADLIAKSKPAVVVVDQRRINKNEISRFSNWAAGPYAWLQENYVLVGQFSENEVFVRPDKATAPR